MAILPGEFHGQRNLAGYSPWVAESDTTEHTYIATTLYRINVYNSFLLLLYIKKKSNFSFLKKNQKNKKKQTYAFTVLDVRSSITPRD